MENGFTVEALSHPALVLAGLPEALRMQLGPFNTQLQDTKGLNLHSLNASAFRLRYGTNYPGFPAHLIHHLQPQLFPTAVDPRSVHFPPGAFRPFTVSSNPSKLFPSAFAPPHKQEPHHDTPQDHSPGNYASKLYTPSDNDDESNFRSPSDREGDIQSNDQNSKSDLQSRSASTSPKSTVKDEKAEVNSKGFDSQSNVESDTSSLSNPEEERSIRRSKIQFDPTCCPICGIMVLIGEAETHFFKELERLSQGTTLDRDRKFLFEKTHSSLHPCFSSFANSYAEENGHGTDGGIPRGRWETYQRIKSNRLSRLRIKNRRRRSGDPLCPVCNEKMQGNVEDINLHVEHCLKKHSDDADEDEEENIDVEGDAEVYGEYDWAGRQVVRATTFLVGGFAASLLNTASGSSAQRAFEKEEESLAVDGDDSSTLTPIHLSDHEVNMADDESPTEVMGSPMITNDHHYTSTGKNLKPTSHSKA